MDEDISTGTNNRWGANEPDEQVDVVQIDHSLVVGEPTQRQTFRGRFGFVTMDLNITVFCVENFQEPDCTQCVTGFTGPGCLEVDNCVGVNCSGRGQCMEGVNSFTCECSPGYTGTFCNIETEGMSITVLATCYIIFENTL